jgi:hypothetical protein
MDDLVRQLKLLRSPIMLDGQEYGPEQIQGLREALIVYRDRAINNFPEGIEMALVLSHTIGVLSHVKQRMEME